METSTSPDRIQAYIGSPESLLPKSPSFISSNEINQALVEWRDTVDAVDDLIILEDSSGRLRRCNRATVDFLGCTFADVLNRSLAEVIRAEEDGVDHLRLHLWEGRLKDRSGWYEIRNNIVGAGASDGCNWVHIVKNVTAKRLAEQELSRLYSVIERSPDSVLITDQAGKVEYANAAFESTRNISRRAFVGRSVHEAVPAVTKVLFSEGILPHLEANPYWRNTNRYLRGHDQVLEEITVSKITDPRSNSISYQFVLRDVTETRQLESIAEAVNLMENYGLVFSGIRHELGNPINSVKMALTVLEMNHRTWESDQIETFIHRCLGELRRVEYLLRTLKSFSIHEEPVIEDVELKPFVENFVSLVRADFGSRGISVEGRDLNFKGLAKCDARALHQVMLNLFANAADAVSESPEPAIRVSSTEGRNSAILIVEDNGRGMSERQISNLFKPFYTSKPDGSGLGLVIVRKMLASMGGTIEIESCPGKGTKATIVLRTGGGN